MRAKKDYYYYKTWEMCAIKGMGDRRKLAFFVPSILCDHGDRVR